MLNELCKEALRIASEHGFTEATPAEDIALMHSELSEALEDIRAGKSLAGLRYERGGKVFDDFRCPVDGSPNKPCGVPSELADVLIRVFHFCGKHGIDLDKAVAEKMQYNDARPHRHGGKTL